MKNKKIQKDWEVVELGEILSLEYGRGLTEKERENGEYPVYGSNGVVGYHSQYIVKGPSIIIGRKGTIGAITWSDKNFWPIDTTYYISLKKSATDLRWLFYKLLSLKLARLNMATGTPGLNRDLVYRLKIFLPPLPEQKKIAEILSTVDEAIEKVNEAIIKTERLKKGLMQELLTKGIGHKEFKDTKISRIPKEWKVVRLKESQEIDLIMGQSPPGESYNEKGEGLPFIQGKAEFGDIYPSPILWTTQPAKIAEGGDVLISVRAPVGDVNICPYRLCIGRGLAAIRIRKGSNMFYFYWFQKEKQRIENIGKGSTFKAITKDELSNFFIPLPTLPEQQKIAEILSTVDKKLELEKKRKEKLERIKKGLMEELLTGKKRVKV